MPSKAKKSTKLALDVANIEFDKTKVQQHQVKSGKSKQKKMEKIEENLTLESPQVSVSR